MHCSAGEDQRLCMCPFGNTSLLSEVVTGFPLMVRSYYVVCLSLDFVVPWEYKS